MTLTANPAAPDSTARSEPKPPTISAVPTVSVILVVREGAGRLAESLDSLAASTTPPARLTVLDESATDEVRDLVLGHEGIRRAIPTVSVWAQPGPLPFGEAVARALAELGPPPDAGAEWLWLLRDGVAVEPDTLERLVEAVRRSPSVGVAGPKVLQWDDPRRLVEAGQQLTRSGRRISAPAVGELDQGQYDTRTDVLAVGIAGMLVRRTAFEQVGGFDPAFAQYGTDLDFGWRAQLAGFRVIVVPAARMREAGVPYAGERSAGPDTSAARRASRRAARRVALTRCSPLTAPFLAVWMVLAAIGSALVLLVLKRPVHAWDELCDLGALAQPVQSIKARWRFHGKGQLRRRDLDTLFVTPGQAARHTLDRVHDALTPERFARTARAGRAEHPENTDLVEPGPVAEEAETLSSLPASLPQRVLTNPGFLAVVTASVVALVGFRDSLREGLLDARGAGLSGGELRPVSTDAAGLWHAFRDSWHGAGLGTGVDSGPHLAVLAALTWVGERLPYVQGGRSPAAVTMTLLLAFGMPLATATAYLAGRAVTSARWPRAVLALAWGVSSVVAVAVSEGRVTALLTAIVLPLVAGGIARVASPTGTFTAAFATALGMGLVSTLAPVLLILGALVAIALLVASPGWARKARAAVLLVVPVALQGPWLLQLAEPRNLLAAPGLLADDTAPSVPWLLALGQADSAPTPLALVTIPVLVAGVASLAFAGGSRTRAIVLTTLGAGAVVGVALAVGAPLLVVGDATGADDAMHPVTMWPGVGVQVLLLAVLSAALVGSDGLRRLAARPDWGWRRAAAIAAVIVVAGSVLTAAGLVASRNLDAQVRVGQDGLPAAAVDQARGPTANRLLRLVRVGDRLDYELVGSEPGAVLRDVYRGGEVSDPSLEPVVAGLAGELRQGGASPGERLADLAVGFVTAQASSEDPLLRTLDATAGLTRLGTTGDETLWRVQARPSAASATAAVPPARVQVTTPDGAPLEAVPVAGPHGAVDHDLGAGSGDRKVVFAQPLEWAAHADVRFDGIPLTALPGQALPTYVLPAQAGHLRADIPPVHREWFVAQVVLVLFVVFMAVPFGNRRSRRLR